LEEAEQAVADLDNRIRRDWRTPHNKRVQVACDDAKLAARFVARSIHQQDVADILRRALRQDRAYVDAFATIRLTVKEFGGCLTAIDRDGSRGGLVETLDRLARDLRQGLEEAVVAFVAVVERTAGAHDTNLESERSNALRVADAIQDELRAQRFIHDADEQQRKRDETKKAAGDAMADKVGYYYGKYADAETRSAVRLWLIVSGLLAVVAVGAIWLHLWLGVASFSTELIRLSATIPVAALAAYFAREASKHRASARWARELEIAMHTIPGYTAPLDDTDGRALRRALGMRVFGSATNQSAAPGAGRSARQSGDRGGQDGTDTGQRSGTAERRTGSQ
jgi:hypothetical protein